MFTINVDLKKTNELLERIASALEKHSPAETPPRMFRRIEASDIRRIDIGGAEKIEATLRGMTSASQ